MDRNTAIGFGLLALLFFGYFYYTSTEQKAVMARKQHIEDSINKLKPKLDTSKKTVQLTDSLGRVDSLNGGTDIDTVIPEQFIEIENNVSKITFTNKGGQPKRVELKNFKTFDGKPLLLDDGSFNDISYPINTGFNKTAQTADLTFAVSEPQKTAEGNTLINFTYTTPSNQKVVHQYVIQPDNYMIDFNIQLIGADQLVTQNTINLLWKSRAHKMEKDLQWETQQSHISFVENGEYDFERIVLKRTDSKTFTKPVDWIGVAQQYFATSIVAKNKFSSGEVKWQSPEDSALHIVGDATANLKLSVPPGENAAIPLQLYYGPNDYKILKSYDNKMFNMVPLGSGIFAFVKYINRGFIMPVFDFMASKIGSLGLVIALLTILIRLLISPLSYQSYLSGAKMKLLKPEVDALKEKYGDDKQSFGMEQMKLFRSAGVNPLGGCIPALLQIPIFFALYNFFNSNITLRGQSFWWANDLSTYDSIANLSFSIPFYGNHISLFTIFAVVTSLLISLYGMSTMQDNSNPMMKYLPFIFPVILLGFFNNLPSALTWYYTVSNVITLLIQFVIQKYIINHEKLLLQLQENKKKPKVKSKWQERVEAMQESNERLKALKEKTENRKR